MELRLGLRVPATGARADVVVRTRDGACLDEVAGALLDRVLPAGGFGRLTCDGQPVPGETLLGAPPLVQGALLEVDGDRPVLPTDWLVAETATGRLHPLPPGGAVVGREGDVRLDDDLVSRRHCRLEVEGQGVRVRDLGSANGTRVDGSEVGPDGVLLDETSLLAVGPVRLTVVRSGPARSLRATGDGRLAVDRPPRVEALPARVVVHVPAPPRAPDRGPLPLLSAIAPVVLGVVMWRVTGSASFLLLTLLSPVLVVGAHVTERRTGRRRSRRERREWATVRTAAEQSLADAVRADELDRRRRWPDPATVVRTATGPGPRLWSRGRDGLDLRLGLADQPARVDADGDLAGLRTTARDVPVVVPLTDLRVLGIAGSPGLLRSIVLQAAVLHGPRDLQLVVLSTGRPDWLRELPQLSPGPGQDCSALLGLTPQQAADRVAELSARTGDEVPVLLVVDGARALRSVPGLAALLAGGARLGVLAVCADQALHLLPPECRATAEVHDGVLRLRTGSDEITGTADDLDLDDAERAARSLAALRDDRRDRDGAQDLPAAVRWADEVGLDLDGDVAAQVAARWSVRGRSTAVLLGRGADGPVVVDLVRDGPHALVAGTTGSGKSELLQTLVASLALGNRPDELALVLVDYKGGAAFGPCARLPHVTGLVTDLDGGLVERALASLGAELSRREAVLRNAGVKDLEDLLRAGGALPRLVLVVDEFASLAEELPDLVTGLVGIAMRGRSLGVHLVLATQRPEGVVSADVRANTNLRLCLAVTGEAESRDVLDSPVAAAISRSTPGRGWVRRGPTELTALQAARVGGRRAGAADDGPVVVALLPTEELGDRLPVQRPLDGEDDTTDLDLLVDGCAKAAVLQGLSSAPSPWLPPLPATVLLPPVAAVEGRGRVAPLAYGVLDVPAEQTRRPLVLDLDTAGHLLVLGAARSGRTTALRSLAGAVATTASADDVHVHALDGGGALGVLRALPHTGAVVPVDDAERVGRLLRRLVDEVVRRTAVLAADGHGGLAEQRAAAAPDDRLPHLLLLVDRWEAFLAAYGDLDGGRHVDAVHRLLREGPAAGLHVVLTADRGALVGRTTSLVDDRLLLRMADPTDYAAAGLPSRLVPDALPPGRGWSLAAAPLTAQVALLDADPSGPAQSAALRRLAADVSPPVRGPFRVDDLPAVVHRRDLPPGAVGVGGDDLLPLALPAGDGLLIGGPPGSGRSTALLAVAAARPDLPVVAVAPRPSPLRELPGCVDDPETLAYRLATGPWLLLLDDVELLVESAYAPVLEQAVRDARDLGSVVAAAGTTAQLLTGYRGTVVELRRARTGVLLSPQSAADGDLLDLRLSRSTGGEVRPGRGLLVTAGRAVPLQVALP